MIVITAPTGQIGHQLVTDLLARGEQLRLVARDPSKLPRDVVARVEVVAGSHADRAVLDAALPGADALFWLPPPSMTVATISDAYAGATRPAAQAVVDHGVGHVVSVSALGRGSGLEQRAGHVTASLEMDDLLASTGAALRALANPSFMDNVLRFAAPLREQGLFFGPIAADHRSPTCATRDIAAAAADLLADRGWSGTGERPVLGPEDLSPDDQAAVLSEVLGKEVRYVLTPVEELREQMLARGASPAVAQAMVDMMVAKQDGLDDHVERTPENTSPTTFRQWCEQVLVPAL